MNVNVTLADVARHAKVGAGTVSRVLNGSKNVSARTRERVLFSIGQLRYVPNLVARGLAANRTGVVGAIIPSIGYSQHTEVIQGLNEVLSEHGSTLMIGQTGFSLETEEKIVSAFLARRPDAFYITGISHSRTTRRLLLESGIPVVEGSNLTNRPIDCVVGYSNFKAGKMLTYRLYQRGYQYVAHVTTVNEPNDRIGGRLKGYESAHAEMRPGKPALIIPSANSFEGGAEAVVRAFESDSPVDALFCANDVMAVGAVLECQRRKIPVPDRLAIAGFDNLAIASSISPTLTTVAINRIQMGRAVGHILLRKLSGEILESNVVNVGFEIIERESTQAR